MRSPRSEFLSGLKAELPLLLGVMPFGMIYGVLAAGAGLPAGIAQGMSSIVFAGSAQFVATQLFAAGTPGAIIVLTTFVVNLRHMLYSASIAPYLRPLTPWWKALLAYLLTDEAYAVTITSYLGDEVPVEDRRHKHWYLLGAGLALWTTWQISTTAGILLGGQVPSSWGLDFTLALTFIALVIPATRDRPAVAAAISAGIVAVLGAGLPFRLGLMLAALTGIVVGMSAEWHGSRRAAGAQPDLVERQGPPV